jgi:phosphatidylserine decarboxylase
VKVPRFLLAPERPFARYVPDEKETFPVRLPIATYGRKDCFLAVSLILLAAFACAALARLAALPILLAPAGLLVGLAAFWASFYRDFERTIPEGEGLVLAPADGRVTDVVEVDEKEYIKGRVLRVGIFLSPLNVHVNRAPVAGTVEAVVHKPGKMLKAYDPRCIEENESTLLGLRLPSGLKLGVRQVTGAAARRIVCAVAPGAQLARGERYGMIKLGSRTELLVPVGSGFECTAKVGDRVAGGVTVLGKLVPSGSRVGSSAAPAHAGEARS